MFEDIFNNLEKAEAIEIYENYSDDRKKAIKEINNTKNYISYMLNKLNKKFECYVKNGSYDTDKYYDDVRILIQEQVKLEKLLSNYIYNYII